MPAHDPASAPGDDARSPPPDDDRTTKARIRDAAITLFAEHGVAATNLRSIAADAGVSAALVIHHFGTKDGLRAACDEYVAAVVRREKHAAAAAGPTLDPLGALRRVRDEPPLALYLARTLADGSPQVAALLDELVADAVVYQAEMEKTGLLRPTKYPRGRAAVLTIWSLGALVLHEHVERLLDADLTAAPDDPASRRPYIGPVLEILGHGVLTEDVSRRYEQVFLGDDEGDPDGDRGNEGDNHGRREAGS